MTRPTGEDAMISEHVEVLRDALRKAFRYGETHWQQADSEYASDHRKAGETMDKFRAWADETAAAIASISAQQPPAEAQAVDQTFAEWLVSEMPAGTVIGDPAWWAGRIARQYAKLTSPPSAPVGVERILAEMREEGQADIVDGGVVLEWEDDLRNALAQQPTPIAPVGVDGVKCPWDGGSPCVEPRPIGMVYPMKPAPRASGYLDGSGVEWNAWDAEQMEAYARAAYSDGWEAGYRSALAQQPAAPHTCSNCEGVSPESCLFNQQPAAVDEAMVERSLQAWFETDDWVALLSGIEPAASSRSRMRAALTAALAAQQGGSDNGYLAAYRSLRAGGPDPAGRHDPDPEQAP